MQVAVRPDPKAGAKRHVFHDLGKRLALPRARRLGGVPRTVRRATCPSGPPGSLHDFGLDQKFLHLHGKKQTGVKADLIERAKEIEGCPRFFDDILADWYAAHPGHVSIDAEIKQEIEDAIVNMERDPVLSSIMQAGSLIDGAAELSAFFTIEGVRCKLRFDYAIPAMKTRNKAIAVDLKSFTTFKGGNDEDAAIRKVYDECYDLQAAHYLDGRKRARDLIAMGKVFGDAPIKSSWTGSSTPRISIGSGSCFDAMPAWCR